jgi:formate/nitrite transporter FocA (FNT family)
MVISLAVFLAGASNDLCGKLVGCWFPISTFVAIGLEHSVANLFIMPAALLLNLGRFVPQRS